MTRINLGIEPFELCDQMLVAEYKELPRMLAFAQARQARYGETGPRPAAFTLNGGHMKYFLPYGVTLKERWETLVDEMRHRGFAVNYSNPEFWSSYPWKECVPALAVLVARPMLIARIQSRIAEMQRSPRWTDRHAPAWVTQAIELRRKNKGYL